MALYIKDEEVNQLVDNLVAKHKWTKTQIVRSALERAIQSDDFAETAKAVKQIESVLAVPTLPARNALDKLLERWGLSAAHTPRWVRWSDLPGGSAAGPPPLRKRLYNTAEAAEYLACTPEQVEQLGAQGELHRVVFLDQARWDVHDMDRLIDGGAAEVPPAQNESDINKE